MKYYVLEIHADVEPFLYGAYTSEARRDAQARKLRAKDDEGENGIFWLNVMTGGDATVGFYSHAELDDNP
ncbi:MAG: hypothetical protein WA183_11780 [Chthoniobacterales bacterium]